MPKKIAKKGASSTPKSQIHYLESCILDCQQKLALEFGKAIKVVKKQQDQLKDKLLKAKKKLSSVKVKANLAASQSKKKIAKSGKQDAMKLEIKKAQQAIKDFELESVKKKQELIDLQQHEKKFHSARKAQAQFEKQWKSKPSKPSASQSVTAKKSKSTRSVKTNKKASLTKEASIQPSAPSQFILEDSMEKQENGFFKQDYFSEE